MRTFALLSLLSACLAGPALAQDSFVRLDPADTMVGYVTRLLINESAFPGERGYLSEGDTQASMLAILWVLDSRIHYIPRGYTQKQVAGVRSQDIIDVITGTGGRRQCEGFFRDDDGNFVTAPRVEERLENLIHIANSGGKPGRFARLLGYAQNLVHAYDHGGIDEADHFAALTQIGPVLVTGRAYSWMTDMNSYHPGGNFVTIPSAEDGSLGGNRFFTLRKDPK